MTVGEYFKKEYLPSEMHTRDQAERYIKGTYSPSSNSDVSTIMNAVLYLIGEFNHELMCTGIRCGVCPYYTDTLDVAECRKNRMQHIKELYNKSRRENIETML